MLDVNARTTPFISSDDGTRIQMCSSQLRQAIALLDPDIPFIRTGYEEEFLNYSSYLFKAKGDGVVVYKSDKLAIIKYDDPSLESDVIDLGGEVKNYDGFDKTLTTTLNKDDRVKKDEILARHVSISDDGFLRLGKNLITTYMSHPYGFKDAIPVSETCSKKMTIKYINEEILEFTDLIPILWNNGEISYPQGTYVNKSQEIFYTKNRNPLNPIHIVSEGSPIRAIASGKLYYKIIIDEVVKTKKEEKYYEKMYEDSVDEQAEIAHAIDVAFGEESLKGNAYIRFYCPQYITKRTGKSIFLIYWIVEEIPILKGCKLSNRHGNKGVCSIIVPDEEMPTTVNTGIHADIIVSPLSVTSRMNCGQLFENHMNSAMQKILRKAKTLDTLEKRRDLICEFFNYTQEPFLNKIFKDNFTEDMWAQIIRDGGFQTIQRPFNSCTYDNLLMGCQFAGMDSDLKEEVRFNGKIYRATFGMNYWYRLEHEPYKKSWGRSVGEYSSLGQPGKGTKAHRLGEMESWALSAYAANENLTEFFVTKSDNLTEASRCLKYLHDGCESIYTPHDKTTGITKILQEYLNACSYNLKINYDDEEEVVDDISE